MAAITRERIIEIEAAYARCLDSNELELWPEFFTDPCLYKVTTAENHALGFEAGMIYADSKAMLIDRIVSLRQANVYEKQSYRHILGLPTILNNGGGEAECETPFLVARIMHDGKTDLFATGRYLATCRLVGNDIKFASKIVVCDSSRIDTLLAIPL